MTTDAAPAWVFPYGRPVPVYALVLVEIITHRHEASQ